MKHPPVPEIRIRRLNDQPVCGDGKFVLYRMLAFRRLTWNFALQHAATWARSLGRPLVIFEEIPLDAPWASRRSLAFILDGVRDHLLATREMPVVYLPFLETEPGTAPALLEDLCRQACLMVEDDSPVDNTSRDPSEAARQAPCRVDAVDSNGLLPLQVSMQAYPTAYSFRRFLHRALPGYLLEAPEENPLRELPPVDTDPVAVATREGWTFLTRQTLENQDALIRKLPVNQQVVQVARRGGASAANRQWHLFLDERLDAYPEARNQPEQHGSSELSAYLRYGQISAHQLFRDLAEQQDWSLQRLGPKPTGQRNGWWGMSVAEAFLDELVTWRELGYNMTVHRPDYREYEALPDWAKISLAKHAGDIRPVVYDLDQFDRAATHDPLWNAAQQQLRQEGTIHNYLRMLWGKKILEWSVSPQAAAGTMIELNNRYALDGCDPNSYSGIYWCLGRYDRAWGPERPIFGKIRYMSSENTARKYAVKNYIRQYQG